MNIDAQNLKRGDYVRFWYRGRERNPKVIGCVDLVTKRYVYVGKEVEYDEEGFPLVYDSECYRIDKMQALGLQVGDY